MNEPRPGKKLLVLDLDYSECTDIWAVIRVTERRDSDSGYETADCWVVAIRRVCPAWPARVPRDLRRGCDEFWIR